MTETEEFLAEVMPAYLAAETAIHNGDLAPRLALWSRTEPLTVLGAVKSGRGWDELLPMFEWVAGTFSDCISYDNEVIAADARGDLAYLVAIEHTRASIGGEPRDYRLRATTVFRREDGEWKIVHRHADGLPAES